MNKLILLTIAALQFVSIGHADVLKTRSYTFTTSGSFFSCLAGIQKRSGGFPVATFISFDLMPNYQNGGPLYSPSKSTLNNSANVTLMDVSGQPCSAFDDLLKASSLDGSATQIYSERIERIGTAQECYRITEEDLTITIGKYSFHRIQPSYLPLEDSECR